MTEWASSNSCVVRDLWQDNHIISQNMISEGHAPPRSIFILVDVQYISRTNTQDVIASSQMDIVIHLNASMDTRDITWLADKFSALGVPNQFLEETLYPRIYSLVAQMKNDPHNANSPRLGMVVAIDILTTPEQHRNAAAEIFKVSRAREIPAIRRRLLPSFEALQMVIVGEEDLNLIHKCAICLEKPSVGTVFARLPCSHMYHSPCMVRWLNRGSNSCPLCRQCIQTASQTS